jgi:uncharacterized protein (DUF1684 family)
MRTYFLLFIVCSAFLPSCQIGPGDNYSQFLQQERMSKDSFMKWSKESPLERPQQIRFSELVYYAGDSNYRVVAEVEKIPTQDTIKMEDTRGAPMEYIRFARLHFRLKNTACILTAYKQLRLVKEGNDDGTLFLPFFDPTNGKGSHEGGRYIDLSYKGGKEVTVDFNKAYNPYCAYTDNYSCPIPPLENKLSVAVEAGEKEFRE